MGTSHYICMLVLMLIAASAASPSPARGRRYSSRSSSRRSYYDYYSTTRSPYYYQTTPYYQNMYYQQSESNYYYRPWYYNIWNPIENLVEDVWYSIKNTLRSARRNFNYSYDRYNSRNETNSTSLNDIAPNMLFYATKSVVNLADSAIQEGTNLINKVTGRLEKVAPKSATNSNLIKMETLWYETSRELEHILYDLTRVVSGDWGASPEVEEKQLIELKKKLKEMNNNQKSVKTHNQVEASLQQILQDVQSLTSEDKIEKFFARVNSAKLQTYKATEVVTKSVDKLSKIINTFFKTLKKVENEFLGDE